MFSPVKKMIYFKTKKILYDVKGQSKGYIVIRFKQFQNVEQCSHLKKYDLFFRLFRAVRR